MLLPEPSPAHEVRCRAHPDTLAEASCARCGDFMCSLCGPIAPHPLCARCSARGSVDWEERGDSFWGRALLSTFREAVSAPRALGARLSGTGRLTWALSYAALCAWLGALPLSLLVSGLLLTVADPLTLGIRSTGVLSLAVTVVLSSIGFASLVPLVVVLWSLTVLATARVLSLPARFELLARASAYGLSLLAVPVLGPLLLPLAWLWLSVSVQAVLASAGDGRRAALAVLWALALWTAPFALLWLR